MLHKDPPILQTPILQVSYVCVVTTHQEHTITREGSKMSEHREIHKIKWRVCVRGQHRLCFIALVGNNLIWCISNDHCKHILQFFHKRKNNCAHISIHKHTVHTVRFTLCTSAHYAYSQTALLHLCIHVSRQTHTHTGCLQLHQWHVRLLAECFLVIVGHISFTTFPIPQAPTRVLQQFILRACQLLLCFLFCLVLFCRFFFFLPSTYPNLFLVSRFLLSQISYLHLIIFTCTPTLVLFAVSEAEGRMSEQTAWSPSAHPQSSAVTRPLPEAVHSSPKHTRIYSVLFSLSHSLLLIPSFFFYTLLLFHSPPSASLHLNNLSFSPPLCFLLTSFPSFSLDPCIPFFLRPCSIHGVDCWCCVSEHASQAYAVRHKCTSKMADAAVLIW